MLKYMMKPKFSGNMLVIDLSKFGYENYIAECVYRFDKQKGQYALSIWLNRRDLDDRMRLSLC